MISKIFLEKRNRSAVYPAKRLGGKIVIRPKGKRVHSWKIHDRKKQISVEAPYLVFKEFRTRDSELRKN